MSRDVMLVVVEGALEVPASLKVLRTAGIETGHLQPIDKGGGSRFWQDVPKYNQAARSLGLVFGLADLEQEPCFSALLAEHLKIPRHPDFILRVARRMLESWLLADRTGIAKFLKVSEASIPSHPDAEVHAKQTLVNLARRSTRREIRDDLVPELGSKGIVGKGYTPRITEFIEEIWNPAEAAKRSPTLERAITALKTATGV